jgi:FkbH-like protein
MKTFSELKHNLKKDNSTLPVRKVALLGDTATQFLSMALKGVAIEKGYNLELFEAEYNQIERQCMDGSSELYQFQADYTIIFQSTHKLLSHYNILLSDQKINLAKERLEFIKFISMSLPGKIIYFNYPEVDDSVFGSFANKIEYSFVYQIRKLNYELMNISIHNPVFFICDIASLQNKIGRDVFFDTSIYTNTEMVLSLDTIPWVASRVMDILCANEGYFKKCLILDLDNTLWGGIIGDDGIENIQLGHGLGIGKAFSEFQYWIKKLKDRGIILAICSKNDEEIAKSPFLKHPEMVLKLEDIAVFIANWNNKADNIRSIQSILNINFDSMVFLDDNPAERAIVRKEIPGIEIPELPEDPADYLEYLYSLNLFETASYSSEDIERTKQYQVESNRISLQKLFTNEADFLKSLNMVSEVSDFNNFNIPRVAQLSQRSNQFNLRTIRYTETDVTTMSKDNRCQCFSFTLKDKFGDNGLIAVVILDKKDVTDNMFLKPLFIDTWFMSCRVLKRGMENFILNSIVRYAEKEGYTHIIGEYIATSKNAMVKNHYLNLGFLSYDNSERELYVLNPKQYIPKEYFITEA